MALPFSTNPMTMAENIRKLEDFDGSIPIDKIPKNYSSDETDTGLKWIDGKAVYMKVLSGTLPEVTASGAFTIAENMDINLLHISGVVLLDGFQVSIPYFNSTTSCGLRIRTTDKVLQAYISSTAFSQRPYRFILLYTKPDPAPSNALNASPDRSLNAAPETDAEPEQEAEPVLKKATRKKTTTNKEEE